MGRATNHAAGRLVLAIVAAAWLAAPMNQPVPPTIFADNRRALRASRMIARQRVPDPARYLFADVAEDVAERLGFLRHQPARSLVLGDPTGQVGSLLPGAVLSQPLPEFPLDQPWPVGSGDLLPVDLLVACWVFDAVNDLPGALIHARKALAPGGLMLGVMLGAGSVPMLRQIMLQADGDRPAARIHPQVDVRAGAQLLQRAGFADPVADSRGLAVRFRSLAGLVGDLRDQGLGAVLAQRAEPLTRGGLRRAEQAFGECGDAQGRVTEHFELLTLSGWRR